MNAAETLAREVARVAALRGRAFGPLPTDAPKVKADVMIDFACRAIGSGDEGRMIEAADQLKAIEA